MEPFVEQLKRLCREHPTRAKWIFVPSHAVGHTLGDRLVLEGCDWANLRFVTPFDIATRMAAPFLVEAGIDPTGDDLGPALIMRLLMELPDHHGYFRPLARHPELGRALWSTITELRLTGVRAADLKPEAFASRAKHAELQALVAAYEAFLANGKRGDRATVYEEARKHLDWCPIQPQDCWTELPDALWSPMERRLIDLMPGEHIQPKTIALPGATLPGRLTVAPVERVPPDPKTAPLAFLQSPDGVAAEVGKGLRPALEMFHAGGAEAEIEEVFRRILRSGRRLDEVEIVCASLPSQTLLWEKCLRYEWPVTLAAGLPAAMTRPGRALVAFTEWLEDDFSAGRLRKLFQSGDVSLPKALALSSGRAARILVKAEAAWGRDTYRLALTRQARTDRLRAERDDIPDEDRERLRESAGEAERLADWIDGIIRLVPDPSAATVPLHTMVACGIAFLEQAAARSNALDAAAAVALIESLGEFESLGDFACSFDEALRFLAGRVEHCTIAAERPRPGHLYISNLRGAAFSSRSLLFVVGLEEGRVFPGAFEDPILLDDERAKVSAALVRAGDRIDEAVYGAIARLAAASARPGTRICLSYSCRDLREFRETYASWLMLQAYRVLSGQPHAEYKDMRAYLGAPKSCVPDAPEQSLGVSRWWLHALVRAGETGRKTVLAQYPSLEAGIRAVEARASSAFTRYDGHVPEAGDVMDPASPARTVSATELEEAASCPYKYFLKRALRVRPVEAGDRDRDVWLTALLRGSLLHELYASLLRRARGAKRRVSVEADRDWFQAEGRKALDEVARDMPPPSKDVGERETSDFLADLDLFVEAEGEAEKGRMPTGFEVGFGGRASRHGDDSREAEPEPLSDDEPVVVDIGDGLSIHLVGRVDRIDVLRPMEAGPSGPADTLQVEIIDYKTGSYYGPGWTGTFAGGTRLQHALYGLAVRELFKRRKQKATVTGAAYRFPTTRGEVRRKVIPAPSRAAVNAVLTDVRTVIANGLFVHAADKDSCKWCDYELACGKKTELSQAEAKRSDPVLGPVRALEAHE